MRNTIVNIKSDLTLKNFKSEKGTATVCRSWQQYLRYKSEGPFMSASHPGTSLMMTQDVDTVKTKTFAKYTDNTCQSLPNIVVPVEVLT